MSFSTTVTGKWIMAGEHSVLRGVPALVFPLWSRNLKLQHWTGQSDLTLNLSGQHGGELQLLFWGVLEKACQLTKFARSDIRGTVAIESSIPIGAGLGASAALCVAVAQWFHSMKAIQLDHMHEFARQLEDLFHGESSGVDIAIALAGKPIQFVRGGERKTVDPQWKPLMYLSYTGKRGVTKECVDKVKALHQKTPELGKELDEKMLQAVRLCETALLKPEAQGHADLLKGLSMARLCFDQWGLTMDACGEHLDKLQKAGALVAKPTGSGDGGYAISLWKSAPPAELQSILIPCF